MPNDRAALHQRIEVRFGQMLDAGFQAEVERLHARGTCTQAYLQLNQ